MGYLRDLELIENCHYQESFQLAIRKEEYIIVFEDHGSYCQLWVLVGINRTGILISNTLYFLKQNLICVDSITQSIL